MKEIERKIEFEVMERIVPVSVLGLIPLMGNAIEIDDEILMQEDYSHVEDETQNVEVQFNQFNEDQNFTEKLLNIFRNFGQDSNENTNDSTLGKPFISLLNNSNNYQDDDRMAISDPDYRTSLYTNINYSDYQLKNFDREIRQEEENISEPLPEYEVPETKPSIPEPPEPPVIIEDSPLFRGEDTGVFLDPDILINSGESYLLHNSGLGNEDDFYVKDLDSPDNEIFYVIGEERNGSIQIFKNNTWQDLNFGESFTQEDVNNSLVRFQHDGVNNFSGAGFDFAVVDETSKKLLQESINNGETDLGATLYLESTNGKTIVYGNTFVMNINIIL